MNYLDQEHKDKFEILRNKFEEDYVSSNILAGAKFDIIKVEQNLLLTMEHNSAKELAGFSILFDDAKKEYSDSYSGFKKLYRSNQEKWSNYNLSFVVYKTNDLESDEFFNSISTDLYFCRKFVLDFKESNLVDDINKLPFIPLEKNSIVLPRRPVSAISILKESGVDSKLAQEIANPNRKEAEKIVTDCLDRDLFNLKVLPENQSINSNSEANSATRLQSITIENFRAYKGKHSFDLDSDLIIIYGPNGLGKTSFFDAFDFVATGSCGRLDKISKQKRSPIDNIKHLDSKEEEDTSVMIGIKDTEGVTKTFQRYLNDHNKILINGNKKNSVSGLMELTNAEGLEKRIEPTINLFRATHLFGQDFQALANDFSKDSSLSSSVVSSMLAFQDYTRSDQKISKIIASFNKTRKELAAKKGEIQAQMNLLEEEVDNLNSASVDLNMPESLKDWLNKIFEEISLNVSAPEKKEHESENDYLRSLRSYLIADIKKNKDIAVQLEDLQQGNLGYIEKLKNTTELNNHSKELKTNLKSIKDLLIEKNKLLELERNSITTNKKNENKNQEEEEKLKEFKTLLSKIKLNQEKTEQENLILDQLEKDLSLHEESLTKFKEKEPELSKDLALHNDSFDKLKLQRKDLFKLQEDLDSYLKNQEKVDAAEEGYEQSKKDHSEILISNEQIEQWLDIHLEKLDLLKISIDELANEGSSLSNLLEELKKYVESGNCPACGQDHSQKDIVLEKISSQQKDLSKELLSKSQELRDLETKINLKKETHYKNNLELESLNKKIASYEDSLELQLNHSESISKRLLNHQLKFTNELLKPSLTKLYEKTIIDISSSEEVIIQKKSEINTLIEDIDKLVKEKLSVTEKIGLTKLSLQKLKNDLREYQDKVTSMGLNFDDYPSKESIESKLEIIDKNLKDIRSKLSASNSKIEDYSSNISDYEKEQSLISTNLEEVSIKIKGLQQDIENFKQKASNLDVEIEMKNDSKVISDKINTQKNILNNLNSLLEKIQRAEVAINSSEITARMSQLEKELNDLQKNSNEIKAEITKVKNWSLLFNNLKTTLLDIKNKAISGYTKQYGPLASMIQSRLRTVYGFGDIQLTAEEGKINVEVISRSNLVRPIDFFSESQKQILVLSLFLAATVTQTWSSLSTLFMDDPVTHFDDLNAYAFLDLLSGILQDKNDNKQFIISTCEERLFQLAKQKFSNHSKDVIVYEFQSIGENGPVYKSRRL